VRYNRGGATGGLGKEKERKSIYIAPFCTKVHTKRSGMDHTVLPANNTWVRVRVRVRVRVAVRLSVEIL